MEKPNAQLFEKYQDLKGYLQALESAAVAYSGGVDSTFLLYAAKDALGDKAIAVTSSSYLFPQREMDQAKAFCASYGIRHRIFKSTELEIEGFADNPKNRCYLCKRALLHKIRSIADEEGVKEVLEGSNLDDEGDFRPGMIAVKELGIKSPLRQIGFSKEEIRILSKAFGLPAWDKPSFACLASRFPYGERITEEKLRMVDRAETFLMDMGFHQLRVRIHGTVARIELVPSEFPAFMDESTRQRVYEEFKRIGFSYVALDVIGYRTGSMNEVL